MDDGSGDGGRHARSEGPVHPPHQPGDGTRKSIHLDEDECYTKYRVGHTVAIFRPGRTYIEHDDFSERARQGWTFLGCFVGIGTLIWANVADKVTAGVVFLFYFLISEFGGPAPTDAIVNKVLQWDWGSLIINFFIIMCISALLSYFVAHSRETTPLKYFLMGFAIPTGGGQSMAGIFSTMGILFHG